MTEVLVAALSSNVEHCMDIDVLAAISTLWLLVTVSMCVSYSNVEHCMDIDVLAAISTLVVGDSVNVCVLHDADR